MDYDKNLKCENCGKMLGYIAKILKKKKYCKKCRIKLGLQEKRINTDNFIGRGIDPDNV